MSARDEILAQIRDALAGDDRRAAADRPDPTPVEWDYGRPTPMDDVLERFCDRLADYRAEVVRCPPAAVTDTIARILGDHGSARVVVPGGLDRGWRAAVEASGASAVDDTWLTAGALDGVDAVVTAAAVGVAETGTIVLDHSPDQGRRALTLVPDRHLCVVRADQVVSDVPEATALVAGAVRQGRPLTWISGPSATSDIELSRVEGVHGPRHLHVIVVDGPGQDATRG